MKVVKQPGLPELIAGRGAVKRSSGEKNFILRSGLPELDLQSAGSQIFYVIALFAIMYKKKARAPFASVFHVCVILSALTLA
jgi:hypothetical protein